MSNSVEFYYMPESPPCRVVEMVAAVAGVTLNKHYINLFTKEQLSKEYLELNPLHKVPFIVHGDLKINESRAIAAYLVDKFMPDDNTFYPKDLVKRARINEILFLDGSLYAAVYKLLGVKLAGPVEQLDEAAEKSYRELLSYLDNRLKSSGGKFLFDGHLTLADVVMAASFSFPLMCDYDISEFKALSGYLESLKTSIPKFSEINDKANENMRNYIKSKQEGK